MATQSLYASLLLANCLRCIFGHRWTDIPNHLPKDSGTTTQGLVAFLLFWLIQLPFAWIHPSKAVPIFAAKTFVIPPILLITMIWALVSLNFKSCLLKRTLNLSACRLKQEGPTGKIFRKRGSLIPVLLHGPG